MKPLVAAAVAWTLLAGPAGPAGAGETAAAGPEDLPVYLKDRGTGVASSMFGTYIRRGDLILYPYWEYYLDQNREYNPAELGGIGETDYRGRYRESEYLFFAAYGLTEDFAIQAELARSKASLEKSPLDPSPVPAKIQESGLNSFETQFRWRWRKEDESRPELWSYLDVVYPVNKRKKVIGSRGLEMELGTGITRGFGWGTLTARAAVLYEDASPTKVDSGEYAVEYLKRLSPSWRIFAAVQGTGDEVSLITEAQWHVSRRMFVRFNQEIGLTSRATDWEPQLGVLFTVPVGGRR